MAEETAQYANNNCRKKQDTTLKIIAEETTHYAYNNYTINNAIL